MVHNPYESGIQKSIPAVLVYLKRPSVKNSFEILMLHRNKNKEDHHLGKWNGLGGKLEMGESPLEAALREVKEESGLALTPEQMRCHGAVTFPNFKPHKKEDWIVFLFTGLLPSEEVFVKKDTCAEGSLEWVSQDAVQDLNLWPGDRHFLPLVLDGKALQGTIWYEGSDVKKFWIEIF